MPITLTRSLLAVLIPGLIALMPWAVLAGLHFEPLRDAYKDFAFVLDTMGFAIVVVVGSFCQSIGSYLEPRWDAEREEEYRVDHYWYAYLALHGCNDAIGFRYISRLANSLYFELSMMSASVLFAIGLGVLVASLFPAYWLLWSLVGLVVSLVSAIGFRKQARDTHETLCITRRELVDRLGEAS
jgi:hypothetical protein